MSEIPLSAIGAALLLQGAALAWLRRIIRRGGLMEGGRVRDAWRGEFGRFR